ncbi:type IV pilin protein [Inhella sp.]|uniref:type IV pilin protein n=1 Tax=Inhella sp. TaxID=1921806 RepID=UPI0035B31E52
MPSHQKPQRAAGFTLVELLLAMVVIAILAALAYPNFINQIRKARRSEAVAALLAVVQAQERWRSNNPNYASDLTSTWPTGLGLPDKSSGQYYAIALSACAPAEPATCFVATATAMPGRSQAADQGCTQLTVIVKAGSPSYLPSDSHRCWSQ